MDKNGDLNSARFVEFLLTVTWPGFHDANKEQKQLVESQLEQLHIFFWHNRWILYLQLRKYNIMIKEMKNKISDLGKPWVLL